MASTETLNPADIPFDDMTVENYVEPHNYGAGEPLVEVSSTEMGLSSKGKKQAVIRLKIIDDPFAYPARVRVTWPGPDDQMARKNQVLGEMLQITEWAGLTFSNPGEFERQINDDEFVGIQGYVVTSEGSYETDSGETRFTTDVTRWQVKK